MRILTILQVFLTTFTLAQRLAVDEAVLDNLIRYAHFSSAAYSEQCEIPPFGTTLEKRFNNADSDTQAPLFRDDVNKEYILAFRGTSSIIDVLTDFRKSLIDCAPAIGAACQNCSCHAGFTRQNLSIRGEIYPYLEEKLAEHPGYSLTITGHSMGGALASIAATALRTQGLSLNVYTYGQPRTGNQAYADYVDGIFSASPGTDKINIMVRATNDNDGIVQVPWKEGGYRHHSTEFWVPTVPTAQEPVFQCPGQESRDCNQGEPGLPLNGAHFSYFGVPIANPLDKEAACNGEGLAP